MEAEINAAVEWWVNVLRERPAHDNGDAFQSMFSTRMSRMLPPIDDVQLEIFGNTLREIIYQRCVETWRPGNPQWGSYMRTFGCDYGPDMMLSEAAESANIKPSMLLFPIKTVMWINPGEVTVRHGYGSEIETIFPSQS
jgi:hypothetical protein